MAHERIEVVTPVGRFVMGDAFKGNDKDMQGRPRFDKNGQPKTTWFMGIAIRKDDPGWSEFWGQVTAVAQRDFPAGQWNQPGFAWKVVDGDGKNQNDKPYPTHCHGCYVVRLSSGFAPKIYNSQHQPLTDPSQCKRGDYVRAYVSIQGNDDAQKPGVYVSHSLVQHVGYGEAILSGPTSEQAFGSDPVTLPPGASVTPVAASAMPAHVAGGGVDAATLPPTQDVQGEAVTPHPTILQGPTS